VQQEHRDAAFLQVDGERLADRVHRGLRRAVSVVTAAVVVGHRAHAAGDDADLPALAHPAGQRMRGPQRPERVHLELAAHRVERVLVQPRQRLAAEDAGVADQHVDAHVVQAPGQRGQGLAVGDVDAGFDLRAGGVQRGAARSTRTDHPVAPGRVLLCQRKADAAVGAGDEDGLHGGLRRMWYRKWRRARRFSSRRRPARRDTVVPAAAAPAAQHMPAAIVSPRPPGARSAVRHAAELPPGSAWAAFGAGAARHGDEADLRACGASVERRFTGPWP
jgi:hypothetical protein